MGHDVQSLTRSMDLNALLRSNEKILCEKSFYFFVRKAWKHAFGVDLIDGIHIAALCHHFQALFEGQMDLLVANIPPGLGKSSIGSVLFGAWAWAKNPNAGMWFSSFGQELVERDSLLMRQLILTEWYQGHWSDRFGILDDQNQKRRYNNNNGGWRLAASVGSKRGFGEHPSLYLIDDPASPSQATSSVEAQVPIKFWDNVISTRGIIKGVKRAIVAQRLAENDLCGYVLENHPEAVHLMMPMEFEPDRKCYTKISYYDIDDLDEQGEPKRKVGWEDPRTEDGQLLCPQVMSREKVDRLKRGLRTAHAIAGQLQQRPTSPDGDMFERVWFDVVDEPPTQGRAIRAWDKASSVDKKADFTAGVCGVDDGEFVYIMDSIVIKKKRAARDSEIISTSILDASKYPAYEVALEQEGGSAGKDAAEISADEIYKNGVMVKVYKPLGKPKKTGDGSWDTGGWELYIKLLSEGKVKLVRGPWVEKFINEHVDAPFGKHDDQIDAAARVVTELFKRRRKGLITRDLLLFTDDDADVLAKDAESQGKSLCNDCGGLGCQGCEFTGHVQRQQQDYMRPLEEDVDDLGVRW